MEDIDEGLYSRQLYVLGKEAMRRVSGAEVLVSGMGGVGAEVAKNLALGGVGALTLHDTRLCRPQDLETQFFLTPADVGRNRAAASAPRVAALNGHVRVNACTCALTEALVRRFHAVVLTEASLHEQLRVAEATHDKGVALLVADARGLYAQLFCDLGEGHRVDDPDGETPARAVVVGVAGDGVVTTAEETPHGLHEGDAVTFREVGGLPELNDARRPRKVRRVLGPHSFQLEEPPRGAYEGGGVLTQAKPPLELDFEPLRRALYAPRFEDWATRPWQLHLAFATLHRYVEQYGDLPRLWNAHDANNFARLSFTVKNGVRMPEEVDAALMGLFAKTCRGSLPPLNAVVGGVAAQEVMKACTGKFTPIRQWLYVDASKGLLDMVTPKEGKEEESLLGEKLRRRLAGLRVFVVGAGAVGCEVLKNLALLGVATEGDGLISVADADHIERSNLNRQLLFRATDVGRPKAVTAAVAVATLNPRTRVEAHEDAVCADTEAVFDDAFFERQDLVVMALDSVGARLYVDQRCVYHRVAALEAGTLGAKGSTQVVAPFLTEAYGSSRDAPERAVPVCTLRNFPSTPEHALLWARDLFDARFRDEPEALRRYAADPSVATPSDAEALETLTRALAAEAPRSWEDCVVWGRRLWQELFRDNVRQLLQAFPPDMAAASGRPFWSPPRRPPTPLVFDAADPLHVDFVLAATNLRARVFGLPECRLRDRVAEVAASVVVQDAEQPPPRPRDSAEELSLEPPPPPPPEGVTVTPLEFEKDDDENLHVDFVVAAANLRAANYALEATDRLTGKLVAGRIVPAIATTTAVVAGLLCVELLKLAGGVADVAALSNHYVNLALPLFATSEPRAAPRSALPGGREWTLWDRFDVEGDLTLEAFLDFFRERYGLQVSMVSHGVRVLYSRFLPGDKAGDRLKMPLRAVVEMVQKKPLEPSVKTVALELSCDDADGNDLDVPYVRYVLPR